MANAIYKSEQVYALSKKVGVSQKDVKIVLDMYINGLIEKVNNGESVKFLNICYIVNSGNKTHYHKTLAYVSTEISNKVNLGKDLVLGILLSYEELIIKDVRKFYSYVVKGLFKVYLEEYKKNVYKVRVKKASNFRNMGIRVVSINSFKRKVEGV